jgi:hypothetical protein
MVMSGEGVHTRSCCLTPGLLSPESVVWNYARMLKIGYDSLARALTLLSCWCARGLLEDGYSDADIPQWVLRPAESRFEKLRSPRN